ncbi:FecCD family ABC transporter permease [Paenibacillus sp. NPDC057967]|uniref:FecCD family ABC transporter permease n=1 Tax=Paenibacillus sp. NPDC057967 TaxID=3346293 RepID=UPI0036DC928C
MNRETRAKRRLILLAVSLPLLLTCAVAGLVIGPVPIPLEDVWKVLIVGDASTYRVILLDIRLPRLLVGMLTGACLAASGAILQSVMRNPLADPGIIGVSAGGGFAAVLVMVALPQLSYLLPAAAFTGALIASLVVYLMAWDKGASPVKIVLAGIAVNALMGALMNGVMVMYSDRVQSVLPWLAGGLNGRGWYHLSFMLPYAAVGLLLTIPAIRSANLLQLGDDSAQLLGQRVERQRMLLVALAALLAGAAVSAAGLIAFVGLVIPHALRLFIGDDYRYLLPLSIIYGAVLVAVSDTLARTLFDPAELPVGILLACIGAPFFLYLLRRRNNWR